MVVVRRCIFLPFVVGMIVAGKYVEHHSDEPDHSHQQHRLNDPQCHGWHFPLSMDEPRGVFLRLIVTKDVVNQYPEEPPQP